MRHVSFVLFTAFSLNSILSDTTIMHAAFLLSIFASYPFAYPFIFNLSESLYIRYISFKKHFNLIFHLHIIKFTLRFLYIIHNWVFFVSQSGSLSLTGEFSSFILDTHLVLVLSSKDLLGPIHMSFFFLFMSFTVSSLL